MARSHPLRALSRSYTLHLKPIAQKLVTQPHLAAREDGKCRRHSEKPCARLLWGSGVLLLNMQRMDIGEQPATAWLVT